MVTQGLYDLRRRHVYYRNFLRSFVPGIVIACIEYNQFSREQNRLIRQATQFDLYARGSDAPAVGQLDFCGLPVFRSTLRLSDIAEYRFVRSLFRKLPQFAIEIFLIFGIVNVTLGLLRGD